MLLNVFRWLTLLILLFWLLVYWQGGFKILADIRSAIQTNVSRLDIFLLILLAVLGLVMTVTAALSTLGILLIPAPEWLTGLGLPLTLTGILGTFFCRAALGKFWTAETAKQDGHAIIDSGPYGVVRHPIYSFAISLYLGLGLVFPAWWNLLAAAGIAVAYALKARDEESFLESALKGYGEYKKRVRYRLLPGIW